MRKGKETKNRAANEGRALKPERAQRFPSNIALPSSIGMTAIAVGLCSEAEQLVPD